MTFIAPAFARGLGLAAAGAIALSALTGLTAAPAVAAVGSPAATGQTYYLDASAGDDADSGTSSQSAWRSLDRVNDTVFEPGDRILLKAGETWEGQLWPKGSGTADEPISVGSYGSGDKPAIEGRGAVDDAVRLFNQEHWVISDLDVSNATTDASPRGEDLRDLRGVHVSGDNGQTLSGITLSRLDVHDVTGEVNWISGDVSGNAPGIRFRTGWDGSKKTGGIVIDATVADIHAPQQTPTILNDITVEDSTIVNTSFAGIVVKQYTGDGTNEQGETIATRTGWGTRTNATDPDFAPHTNITIRGNYITQDGTDYGCNGMYLTNIRGGLVEGNVVERAGTSGIETYYADEVVIQYNEVFDTQRKAGGADSNGIDPDRGTTAQLIQYNYLHGNGDGVLICQFSFGDAVIRNNVIAENTRYPIYLHSDRSARAEVYNNTIFNTRSNYLIYGYGSSLNATYDIRDNVIHSTRAHATLTTSPTINYDNNLYSGAELTVPADDGSALIGDALFAAPPANGPYGDAVDGPRLDTAFGYAVMAGSKAVNTASGADGADLDFAGMARPVGPADIGAFEYRTAPDATTEAVAGVVRDEAGRRLAGASVTAAGGGVTRTATTDATGWFRATGLPRGAIEVSAERTGYSGQTDVIRTDGGTSGLATLTLASTSDVGSVSGTVRDVTGAALTGATVEVAVSGGQALSTTSGADGSYTVADVPVGEGYTVTARAEGLRSDVVAGIQVDPGADTAVRALLLQPDEPVALFADDVDERPLGAFSSGTDGYTVSASGGSVAVTEAEDGRAFTLTRSANSGSTSLQRTFADPLTGIVTVEARVMRDDAATAGSANWFSVPYIRGTNGTNVISLAFSRGSIVAYQGTQSTELAPYEQGRWYTLTTIVDTVNERFDLRIDGDLVLDDARLRAPLSGGISVIDYYANSSNYGTVHIDDLRILQGSERDRSDASLAALSTSAGAPSFDGERWNLDVPVRVDELTVSATPGSETAQGITIAGEPVAAAAPSEPVSLAEGENDIAIEVVAEDGTVGTHVLRVRRASSAADASLDALSVSGGELQPVFAPDIEQYTATLQPGTTEAEVAATPYAATSTVTVGGTEVGADGTRSLEVSDGDVLEIGVTSGDGTAEMTYTVALNIAAAPDPDPQPEPEPEPQPQPQPQPEPEPEPQEPGTPLPETGEASTAPAEAELTAENRGGISGPATVQAGATVTITVGSAHSGARVFGWLFSTPVALGFDTVSAAGTAAFTIPADAPAGIHRIAVTSEEGTLLGWYEVEVLASNLSATGGAISASAPFLGAAVLLLGVGVLVADRRRRLRA